MDGTFQPSPPPHRAPAMVGADLEVPLVGGGSARYVNLDYAASTPALAAVWEGVQALLPWYSSVHRGAGFRSQVATAAYEGARDAVRAFLSARPEDAVIFTRNTTDAINLLARCLAPGTAVVTTLMEHHANLLPWRRLHQTRQLPVPIGHDRLLDDVRGALRSLPAGRAALLAVTGASNVTGEVWPIADLASLAHEHGTRIVVDAAQLAPHRAVDMTGWDLDWVALSGHKLYAPFGAGALVGRPDWLATADGYLAGGGAVAQVSAESVVWTGLPDRHEGGSPNVVGAYALGVASTSLREMSMNAISHEEARLTEELWLQLARVPGLVRYRTWPGEVDRLGIAAFNLPGRSPSEVAAVLSAEHGIGVRSGSFCAHPLLAHLAAEHGSGGSRGCGPDAPGAVRASLGLGTTLEDIARLGQALRDITRRGARWTYRAAPDGTAIPVPDDRPLPGFLARTASPIAGRVGTSAPASALPANPRTIATSATSAHALHP